MALAFQPVRHRTQRFANRLVYGQRATPYEVLSDFSGQVAHAYSVEDILPKMAQIVAAGTGAARTEVWLRVGAELRSVARWPQDGAASPSPVPMPSGEIPEFGEGEAVFPVVHQGDMLGAIAVQAPAGDPITADKEKLIANLAAQASLVLRNVRLLEDIRASRQRIVTALDIGTSKICCLIAKTWSAPDWLEVAGEGVQFEVLGFGHHRAEGLKGGMVTHLDRAEHLVPGQPALSEVVSDPAPDPTGM